MHTHLLKRLSPLALAWALLAPPGARAQAPEVTIALSAAPDCRLPLKNLHVRVASTEGERAHGLGGTYVPLAENAGMLFAFDSIVMDSFWMKDLHVPLAVAFFDAAHRLIKALEMPVEPNPAAPKNLYSPGVPYQTAVESAPGTFSGMRPGAVFLCAPRY
jgi:uncharacterized membrane protein (UPF0127 family)